MSSAVPRFSVPARIERVKCMSFPAILCVLGPLFFMMLFLRCPATLLRAEFWAEDGLIWYADAYAAGWHSLLLPQNGYLQTVSRLVALLAQLFPLAWAPSIFAGLALIIEILTAVFIVSARMSNVWPSIWGRVLFASIYVSIPNSFETHANLTNTQWHLAILGFCVLISAPAESRVGTAGDLAALALSGLSGPFCIFLVPIAIWQLRVDRSAAQLRRTGIVAVASIIQGGFLLATAGDTRSAAALGASVGTLAHIIVVQILLGALLGARAMSRVSQWTLLKSDTVAMVIALGGLSCFAIALSRGPSVLRKAALFGGTLFAGALWKPQVSATQPQWTIMMNPGAGQRYYLIPMLVWIGALLALAADRNRALRYPGMILIMASVTGIVADWSHPRFAPTGFATKAQEFALAPPGTRMELPLQPPGFGPMILIKQTP
jgi:hypothetical protein